MSYFVLLPLRPHSLGAHAWAIPRGVRLTEMALKADN